VGYSQVELNKKRIRNTLNILRVFVVLKFSLALLFSI